MRSITGDGVLSAHSHQLAFERMEVPSVSPFSVVLKNGFWEAYDRPEWDRILDAGENTLHLLNYSAPFRGKLSAQSWTSILQSSKDAGRGAVRDGYYVEKWGKRLSQRQRDALPDGDYEVVVTEFADGSLTISRPSSGPTEVLISTTPPSVDANNELSGP